MREYLSNFFKEYEYENTFVFTMPESSVMLSAKFVNDEAELIVDGGFDNGILP